MSKLHIQTQEIHLSTGDNAIEGGLAGSLDLSNVGILEKQVQVLVKKGIRHFSFDCSKLDYVNSTGMGLLLKLSDHLAEQKGRIHFFSLPPRIEALVKMLGLHEAIHIYPTQAMSRDAFARREAQTPAVRFPLRADCPSCGAEVEFPEPGKFRCPVCNEYFDMSKDGEISSFAHTRLRFVEIKMPLSMSFLPGLQSIVEALCKEVHLTEEIRGTLLQVVDEFCNYLLFQNDPKKNQIPLFHLIVIVDTQEARIVFRGQTPIIENLNRELEQSIPLKMISKMVDSVDLINLPKGGQLVSLVKTYKTPVAVNTETE